MNEGELRPAKSKTMTSPCSETSFIIHHNPLCNPSCRLNLCVTAEYWWGGWCCHSENDSLWSVVQDAMCVGVYWHAFVSVWDSVSCAWLSLSRGVKWVNVFLFVLQDLEGSRIQVASKNHFQNSKLWWHKRKKEREPAGAWGEVW